MNKKILIIHIIANCLFRINRIPIYYTPNSHTLLHDKSLILSIIFFLVTPLTINYIVYFYSIKRRTVSKHIFWVLFALDAESIFSVIFMAILAAGNNPTYKIGFIFILAYHLMIMIPRIIVSIKTYRYLS